MRKDDALQAAKLSFMQDGNNKNALPYYWANIILAGNGHPVALSKTNNLVWWIVGTSLLVALFLLSMYRKKQHSFS